MDVMGNRQAFIINSVTDIYRGWRISANQRNREDLSGCEAQGVIFERFQESPILSCVDVTRLNSSKGVWQPRIYSNV